MPRPLPLKELTREALRAFTRDGAPRWRSTAAVFTSMSALAATSLLPGPALAEPRSDLCALKRTAAHHSEGVDTWNAAYTRPTRPLDAVMVFLSFPDSEPQTTPAELTADYFPATSDFFERASYGRFALRPHPQRDWIRMPHASTSYAIQRDWGSTHRAAYLRDALAVADGRVDFSRYDIVYLVADPDAPGVDSDATKVVNLDTPCGPTARPSAVSSPSSRSTRRTASSSPTRRATSSTSPTSTTAPSTARATGTPTSATGTSWAASSASRPTCSAGTSGSWAGWIRARSRACGAGEYAADAGAVGCRAGDGRGGGGAHAQAPGRVRGGGFSGSGRSSVSGDSSSSGARTFGSGRGTKLAVARTGPDTVLAFEARGSAGNDGTTCTQGVLVYRVRSEAESGRGPIEVLDAHPAPSPAGRTRSTRRSRTRRWHSGRASPCPARTYGSRWRTGRPRGRGR